MIPLNPTLLYVSYAQHKIAYTSNHVFPLRKVQNYELSYFLNDSACKLSLDQEDFQIKGDTVVFRRPGQENQSFMPYESILIGFTFDTMIDSDKFHGTYNPRIGYPSSIVSHPLLNNLASVNHTLKQTNYRQIFEDIYKESLLSRQFSPYYASGKILELLYSLYYERDTFVTHHQQPITDAYLIDLLKYVEAHLSYDFTIKTMSRDLAISERKIYNLFKQHLNVTPLHYINESKLNYAKNLLVTSNLSVHEIAALCGYDNSTYFITLFRKSIGTTPLKYRRAKMLDHKDPNNL